jgi:hypothetical protein
MRGKAKLALAAAVAVLSIGAPASASAAQTPLLLPDPLLPIPDLNWTALLPPAESPNTQQPGPVPDCEAPSIACIDTEIANLKALRDSLGCDHRAIFASTYLELTWELREALDDTPNLVFDRDYLYTEDALFASFYFDVIAANEAGEPVPPAWQIALDATKRPGITATQDMLLGINAHVQNDMPQVIAALGVRTPDGHSRKPDHDAINKILNRAYTRVVNRIAHRYDPVVGLSNLPVSPVDDIAGLELVRIWRELVWRNAERLVNAPTEAQRAQVKSEIESHAALWATAIATPVVPGATENRDAHCAAQAGT